MKNSIHPEINPDGCSGFCARCQSHHSLARGRAEDKALLLLQTLERQKRITIFGNTHAGTAELSTAPLFGEERGKMFGILECRNRNRETIWLHAFSGQYQGIWSVPGWAPPLFAPDLFGQVNIPAEKEIKELGRRLETTSDMKTRSELLKCRRLLSRNLMTRLHRLYQVPNFRGETTGLDQAFLFPGGKPTGTGDCCAPKLLGLAARSNLVPVSISEFFFGRSNRSGTRTHGRFYPPCEDKCRPLLGYMLCGVEERKKDFGI